MPSQCRVAGVGKLAGWLDVYQLGTCEFGEDVAARVSSPQELHVTETDCFSQRIQLLAGITHHRFAVAVPQQVYLEQVVHHALVIGFAVGLERRHIRRIEEVPAVGQREVVAQLMHEGAGYSGVCRAVVQPLAQGDGYIRASHVGIA